MTRSRTVVLGVRLLPQERVALEDVALAEGCTASEVVRRAVCTVHPQVANAAAGRTPLSAPVEWRAWQRGNGRRAQEMAQTAGVHWTTVYRWLREARAAQERTEADKPGTHD